MVRRTADPSTTLGMTRGEWLRTKSLRLGAGVASTGMLAGFQIDLKREIPGSLRRGAGQSSDRPQTGVPDLFSSPIRIPAAFLFELM
jgi:hypothetical protein